MVDSVWIAVIRGPDDGVERIAIATFHGQVLPLVCGDAMDVPLLIEMAGQVARSTGEPVEVKRFTFTEVVAERHPEN
jgi:hypothetical protein